MVIGIYPRKSVYRDNSESVSTQIKLCKEYSEIIYRGQELKYMVYDKDEGFSGKNVNRPGYRQLIKDVRGGLLDVVMVYKLDRISRNVQDFSNTFALFQEYGVVFVSVKESFDTSTPIGRTVMYILAAFAQLERENTSERVTDSMLEMAKCGFWTGGRTPLGMKAVRKTVGGKEHSFLAVDEQTVPLVQKLYSLFLSGMTITSLERYCRSHGITSPAGKDMQTSQLHFILSNPVYCQNDDSALSYFHEKGYVLPDHAEALFDGSRGLIGYGRKSASGSPGIIALGSHDYVIAGTDWVAVQRRLGINKQIRTSKYELGILKGVLRCKCGGRVVTKIYHQKGIQYRSYLCSVRDRKGAACCGSHHIQMDRVDDLFLSRLKELKLFKNLIVLQDLQKLPEFDEKAAEKEKHSIEIKIQNLTKILEEAKGQASAKYVLRQIEHLDEEYERLENDIRRSRRQADTLECRQNNINYVYEQICDLLNHFDQLSYKEKNETIRKLVKECIFDDGKLIIKF